MKRLKLIHQVLLLALLNIGCGGSSEPKKQTEQPPDNPPASAPVAQIGNISLTVKGLPDDNIADVEVIGPNDYVALVNETSVLSDLEVGKYTVNVYPVTKDDVTYAAVLQTISFDVIDKHTSNVTVSYFDPNNTIKCYDWNSS